LLVALAVAAALPNGGLFELRISLSQLSTVEQAIAKVEVPLPVPTPLLEDMQVVGLWRAPDKIVAARNAIFAKIAVPQRQQQRHQHVSSLKVRDRNGHVQDGLGREAGDSGAADVLYVKGAWPEGSAEP